MTALNLRTVEAKAFVPARDFELSKRFYTAIGFSIPWSSDDLAYVHHGNCSFLLQQFYLAQHAQNFQMHLLVENADDWWRHLAEQNIAQTFGVDIGALEDRPWMIRDFTLVDPTGVLWRIGHNLPV
ncbi:VOC family protein [Lysobacter sp. TAB13]|uniref:VOC family protein n=1 Tax=Lysobacter sp. TAB13 TaxID=3233065 RepID=UPI003F97740C